jgi:transmembrane sensor
MNNNKNAVSNVPELTLWERFHPHWKFVTLAAILLACLCDAGSLPLRLKAEHLTVAGQRQRVQLPYGARVLLNTHSALSTRHGNVRLYEGEAWFEVPANLQRPLQVRAGPLQANASDCAFALRYVDGIAQVQVQHGQLELHANAHEKVTLNAGEGIRFGVDGFGTRQLLGDTDLAWVQGRLIFENRPLKDVLTELQRYYPGWIINTNAELANTTVTGNYRLDEPLAILHGLALLTSAQIQEFPALIILR